MSIPVRCSCSHQFACDDDDRGAKVYCPSCGTLCKVPEEAPADASSRPDDVVKRVVSTAPTAVAAVVVPHDAMFPAAPAAKVAEQRRSAPSQPGPGPRADDQRAPRGPARSSVFSTAGAAKLQQQVVRQVACLCGAQNPVRLEDLVGAIYCHSCGAEIDLAEKLAARRASTEPEGQPTAVALATPRRRRSFGWLLGAASGLACAAVLVWIGLTAFRQPSDPTDANALSVWIEPPTGPDGGPAPEFNPARLSTTMIEALVADPKPFRALSTAYAWQQGLADHQVALSDARYTALAEVARRLLADRNAAMLDQIEQLTNDPRPDRAWELGLGWRALLRAYEVPDADSRCASLDRVLARLEAQANEITLEMIESLAGETDATEALVQAQIWSRELADRQVPDSDPRRVRLQQLIEEFMRRLVPEESGPPPHIAEFNQLLDNVRDQLGRRELDAAEQSIAAAEKLFEAHPEDLAPLAKRLLFLKQKLAGFRDRGRGIDGVREQFAAAASALTEAERLRDAGQAAEARDQVTAAVELQAHARRAAYGLSLSQPQIDELEKQYRELEPRLRFARGWRAALDAEVLDKAGDAGVRDWAVGRVRALLPGLPEPQIAPWLKRVERWKDAQPLTLAAASDQARSLQGKAILLSERYEALLEEYAQAKRAAWLDSLRTLIESLPPENERDPRIASRIGNLALDLAEQQVLECLQVAEKDPASAATHLAQARQVVNALAPWRTDPRYQTLATPVDQACRVVIEARIESAKALAEQDKLNEAIAALRDVEPLAAEHLLADLRSFGDEWSKELALRNNRQAENDAWQRVEARLAQPEQAPQAEAELRAFLRRYSASRRRKAAEAHLEKLVASDERTAAIERALAAIGRDLSADRFAEARNAWSILANSYPADSVPKPLRPSWQERRMQLANLPERALAELAQLGKLRRMTDVQAVLAMRAALPRILEMDPTNAEAIALNKRLARSSEAWAKRLLSSARLMQRAKNQQYKELASQVQQLDPDGPFGREAKRLLGGG